MSSCPFVHYLVPGPSKPHPTVLNEYSKFYGSSDCQIEEFVGDYDHCTSLVRKLLHVPSSSSIVITSGEGMFALWAGISNTINKGDKVISIAAGIYGRGIGEMFRSKEAEVINFSLELNEVFRSELHRDSLEKLIQEHKPKVLSAVHCDTPCGTLIPHEDLKVLGDLCKQYSVLFYIDCVSSAFGVELDLTSVSGDVVLVGSQKCLSLAPDLSIVIVSKSAWDVIEAKKQVQPYTGYDNLLNYQQVIQPGSADRLFPMTMCWSSIKALICSLQMIDEEGISNVIQRHNDVALLCQQKLEENGLQLYSAKEISSPTTSCVLLPENVSWTEFDSQLRSRGVLLGGSYGSLAGKVFRIGHMGTQAQTSIVAPALDIIIDVIKGLSNK